ncbi:hypothetical protein PC121_g7044 [Phytophthora cactorum]|nr:hypothetical protein PC120_g6295 [Phytophthora cactorum]KAG3079187.1 hypothetical protein PC121_g7044 [Phytophthora cactorum]
MPPAVEIDQVLPHSRIRPLQLTSIPAQTMAQISPLAASDEVTVVVFLSKDDNMNKTELVDQRPSLKYKIFLGLLYTLASCGFLYGCMAAITFFGDMFTLLLALTRQ